MQSGTEKHFTIPVLINKRAIKIPKKIAISVIPVALLLCYISATRKPAMYHKFWFLLSLQHKQMNMETILSMPVGFTDGAILELKRLMNEEGFNSNQKLRVGVKGGGCSGMTYVLGFDEQLADDEYFEYEGIPCVMNKGHEMYLYGMQIDFQDGLNSRGFTFTNPNASSTCGCGTPFAV